MEERSDEEDQEKVEITVGKLANCRKSYSAKVKLDNKVIYGIIYVVTS